MKQITNKTILIQEIGQEKCKEYGCGNSECIFECLNPKKIFKTYQPVEVDGVIYWYEESLGVHRKTICLATKDPTKYCNGTYLYSDKDPGSGKVFEVVAQSQGRLEEIPVVSLDKSIDDFIYEYQQEGMLPSMAKRRILTLSNPNQYTQKDIDKAIELAQESGEYGYGKANTKEKILQQINSISVIEVDEQFNIISYE